MNTMKPLQLHCRLHAIYQMIEETDKRLRLNVQDMNRTTLPVFRNVYAKRINKYKRIKYRLAAYYADVFGRMAEQIAKDAVAPCEPSIDPQRQFPHMVALAESVLGLNTSL